MAESARGKVITEPVVGSPAIGAASDPYRLNPEDVAEPPRTLPGILRRIGPGMILAASIVGSGELIATTTLGAQVGYTALWLILLSCLIKPVIQAELGRYTIASGETGLEGLNRVPGPRLRVNWIVWAWAVMTLCTMLQVGAMFGGVAQVMNLLIPAVSVNLWVVCFLVLTLILLLGGGYERIERLAMVKVALFTMLTFLAALLLIRGGRSFSWAAVMDGLRLQLPGEGLATAVAVVGITGVGASELFMYPYWCVEKGYARFAGRRDGTAAWERRASGWVRVMHVDIISSMIVYTVATVAFYLLGAGVLNGMGLVPAAGDMIPVLSNIYTQTLGPWSLWLFYAGAIATLYGTIFAATAANSRVFADMARLVGLFAADDYRRRVAWRKGFVVLLTVLPVYLYWLIESPVRMVVLGGLAQALMLPALGVGALYLRHRRLPQDIAPPLWITVTLWLATLIIICLMGYYAFLTAQKM
ncbi:MAG TPA: Nramp family divalent metal transporter [Blastocatellia bacterium]|nr:Nramp family divalent metal transporter [Blastocatellia bacterium]